MTFQIYEFCSRIRFVNCCIVHVLNKLYYYFEWNVSPGYWTRLFDAGNAAQFPARRAADSTASVPAIQESGSSHQR